MTVTRFLSNEKCVIQKQRRHVFPVMLIEGKLDTAKENICILQAPFLGLKSIKQDIST